MLKKSYLYNFFTAISVFLFASCAQQVSPTGGAIDKDPPKLLRSEPMDSALNFQGNEINLKFNEYIQLNDAQNQLLISPPLKEQPELVLKNKELKLKLKNIVLKQNTTYTVSFGSSIADITENNADEDFSFVFSTGEQLDTGKLKGVVKSAKDLLPQKGVFVMLYKNQEDSVLYKHLPDYIAKTNKDGAFSIEHVSKGEYKIVALKDINQNYLYDQPTEEIAFIDTLIKENGLMDLFLFSENNQKQFVQKVKDEAYGLVQVIMNKPLIKPEIITIGKKNWLYSSFSTNNDTISFWYQNSSNDSLKVIVKDGASTSDTVLVPYKTLEPTKTASGKGTRGQQLKFIVTTIAGQSGVMRPDEKVSFIFNYPLKSIDTSKIVLFQGEKKMQIKFSAETFGLMQTTALNLFQPAESYKLIVLPGAFKDIFGLTNDTLKAEFKVGEKENYGNLILSIKPKDSSASFILTLLDAKDKPISNRFLNQNDFNSGKAIVNFNYLLPGEYSLKLTIDNNANNKWDTGEYLKHLQPEKIIFSGSKIQIRENWDNEQEWIVE